MYRCMGCDAPAQADCSSVCPSTKVYDSADQQVTDPWQWPDEPNKLDINAGVHVPAEPELAYG